MLTCLWLQGNKEPAVRFTNGSFKSKRRRETPNDKRLVQVPSLLLLLDPDGALDINKVCPLTAARCTDCGRIDRFGAVSRVSYKSAVSIGLFTLLVVTEEAETPPLSWIVSTSRMDTDAMMVFVSACTLVISDRFDRC